MKENLESAINLVLKDGWSERQAALNKGIPHKTLNRWFFALVGLYFVFHLILSTNVTITSLSHCSQECGETKTRLPTTKLYSEAPSLNNFFKSFRNVTCWLYKIFSHNMLWNDNNGSSISCSSAHSKKLY